MMIDYNSAKTIAYTAVKIAWDDACAVVVGEFKALRYDRLPYSEAPPVDDHWARISLTENDSFQDGFTARVNSDKKAYLNQGRMMLQMFAPKKPQSFIKEQNTIAKLMRQSFRRMKLVDDEGCRIVLMRVRIVQMPEDEGVIAINVIADFEYREIQ